MALALASRTEAADVDIDRTLPPAARLSLVTTVPGLEALAEGWRRLEHSCARPHLLFQTFDWVASWARTYAGPGAGLAIVTGHVDGALAFVWPLMKVRNGPVSVLRWLSEPLAQYGDILLKPGHDPDPWVSGAVRFLRQHANADSIRLRHVRDDAAVAPYLRLNFRDAHVNEKAPWLDLTSFASAAAYEARYTSSQRKRRKKIRKRLEEAMGPVEFKVLGSGFESGQAMSESIVEKCKWIEERGRQNRVLGCPDLIEFLGSLSHSTSAAARLVITCMTAGGKPVSWEIGIRCGKTHFAFITSHVNALTDYSPGRLHMDYSQRLALKDGMTAFDLMVPYDPHKDSWCSAMAETRDYHLPLTGLGWAYGRLYLEALRPALRATYYRLPPLTLKALKPLIRH